MGTGIGRLLGQSRGTGGENFGGPNLAETVRTIRYYYMAWLRQRRQTLASGDQESESMQPPDAFNAQLFGG